jgi:hypothetical protein
LTLLQIRQPWAAFWFQQPKEILFREAGEIEVEIQLVQLRQFDGQPLVIPARQRGRLVIGQRKLWRALQSNRKPGHLH